MASRFASINDLPLSESDRRYHWPLGLRPENHQGQLPALTSSITPRHLPDKTLQLPKGFRSLSLFALYRKHL